MDRSSVGGHAPTAPLSEASHSVQPSACAPGVRSLRSTNHCRSIGLWPTARLAIPLLPERADRRAIGRLNPTFVIHEKRYVLYTQHMLAVPVDGLKQPIANLGEHRDEIVAAVDFLQQGF